jgi:hypothetical protein
VFRAIGSLLAAAWGLTGGSPPPPRRSRERVSLHAGERRPDLRSGTMLREREHRRVGHEILGEPVANGSGIGRASAPHSGCTAPKKPRLRLGFSADVGLGGQCSSLVDVRPAFRRLRSALVRSLAPLGRVG